MDMERLKKNSLNERIQKRGGKSRRGSSKISAILFFFSIYEDKKKQIKIYFWLDIMCLSLLNDNPVKNPLKWEFFLFISIQSPFYLPS